MIVFIVVLFKTKIQSAKKFVQQKKNSSSFLLLLVQQGVCTQLIVEVLVITNFYTFYPYILIRIIEIKREQKQSHYVIAFILHPKEQETEKNIP